MKYYFIINPASGKGGHKDGLCENITRVCEEKGIAYECYITKAVGDATEFVRGICERKELLPARFYACGGDGTFGEVVNGVGTTEGASVGIIPVGTGNDFVRNFGSDSRFFDIAYQIDGEEIKIDLLRCNDTYAVNMVNIGFDCEVVKKKEEFGGKPYIPAKLAYVAGVVATLFRKPTVKLRLSLDGEDLGEKHFLLTTIANGCFCGGGFKSNPYSYFADGMIDLLCVNNVSRTKFVSLIGSYKKGTHIVEKNFNVLENKKVKKIEMRFPEKRSASIDGELYEFRDLTIECIPNAVSFVVPKGVKPSFSCEKKAELTV